MSRNNPFSEEKEIICSESKYLKEARETIGLNKFKTRNYVLPSDIGQLALESTLNSFNIIKKIYNNIDS